MSIRTIIFWVHLTVGIVVGLVVLIMASTGMMLAFRGQIIDFVEHGRYKIESVDQTQSRLKLQDLIDKVREGDAEANPTAITLNSNPQVPVVVKMGEDKTWYVDPYSGVILGNGSSIRWWFEDVEYWHRWLGMKGDFKALGGGIKRACNVAFFFMILTGFYLWWPRHWTPQVVKSMTQFNFKLKGQSRDWNWHNVIGFWCAPFLIVISLTGIMMSYPWANDLLYRMTGNQPPVMGQESQGRAHQHRHHDEDVGDDDDEDSALSLDDLFSKAQEQASDWKTITLRLSKRPEAPAVFNIEEPGLGHRSQLTLNRMDGKVIKWEPYSTQNSGRKLRTFVRFLHTGEVGGWMGQAIAFFAAGGLILLVWTGFAKSRRRFLKRNTG